MRPRWVAFLVPPLAAFLLAHPAPASADEPDKARCAAAYERAQELQRTDALTAARKQLVICRETCPGRLRRDCLAWIDDVDALMPTIVLRPHDSDGRPIRQARVTIDGELLVESIEPSTSLPVDPGTHVVRFEHPDLMPAEVRVTIHGGEREREVAITLWRRAPPDATPPSSTIAKRTTAPLPESSGGHRAAAYAFGIGGLVALATGGGLAIAGLAKRSDLHSACAPFCDQGDVDSLVTLWRFAAATAVVGAVSLGVGTYLWFSPRKKAAGSANGTRRLWVGASATTGVLGGTFD